METKYWYENVKVFHVNVVGLQFDVSFKATVLYIERKQNLKKTKLKGV